MGDPVMKKFAMLAIALFALAACEVEDQPSRWGDHLDPYMAKHGYTLNDSSYVIFKNNYPVWKDEPCYGRGCFGNNMPLVPGELVVAIRNDYFAARAAAEKAYVADISAKIGVEPVVVENKDTVVDTDK
jgi:hypothetical protein